MKRITTILSGLLFLLPALSFSQVWTQIGGDIDGEAANSNSGNSVSLSADGKTVAIGAKGDNSGTGQTRVYQVSSGSWSQVGLDIEGQGFENAGASVSLSADGLTLAVGSPFGSTFNGLAKVYQFSGGIWSQIGSDINGTESFGNTGSSLTLSGDGSTLVIDTQGANSSTGLVQVYVLIAGSWTQVGSDISGEASGDASGRSLSVSYDGTIVAIGAPNNNSGAGHVRVYENIATVWTQIGSDIDGETSSDMSGEAVSLSADGTIVAIGGPGNNGTGHVRVYENNSGTWSQIGVDIDGVGSGEYFGTSLGISDDGNTVVIGANQLGSSQTGLTRVYKFIGGAWSQTGSDIVAEAVGDESGEAVSISSDGFTVAIGAIANDGNGASAGQVRVYNFCTPSAQTDVQSVCGSLTWIDGVTYTSNNNTATHTLTNVGGCDSVVTLNLTIVPIDNSINQSGNTLTANQTAAVYQWLNCDNNYAIIAGQTNQGFTASANGNYAVEISQNGCLDTSACYSINSIGVFENNFGNDFLIYPNPSTGRVNINLKALSNVSIRVLAQNGQVIYNKTNFNGSTHEFNLNTDAGIYILEIASEEGIRNFKLIIE